MILIIDAYNVIHAVPVFESKLDRSLHASREYLTSVCRTYQAERGDVEKIILVFDGSTEVAWARNQRVAGIEAVYTETGEDADDRIIEILRVRRPNEPVVVVSNDNYVCNNSRALGAKVISSADFYASVTRKNKPLEKRRHSQSTGKAASKHANAITAEYKKHLGIS